MGGRKNSGWSVSVSICSISCANISSPLALPLGELSPKVTERALQARSNGNSKQRESQVSLATHCCSSSYCCGCQLPYEYSVSAGGFPVFRPVLRDCRALLRKARNDKSGNLPRLGRGAGGRQGVCIPRLKAIGVWGKCRRKLPHFPHTPRMRLHPAPKNRGWVTDFADQISR